MDERRKIFVFGSNLAGVHGAGAALAAYREHGAEWGCGVGLTGNSYALPTKDHDIRSLPIEVVAKHIQAFMGFARIHPELEFQVTRVGCGLAGNKDKDVAPLFSGAPENCVLPEGWREPACHTCGKIGCRPMDHAGWTPDDDKRG